jgi:hypothetical protein
MGTPGTWDGTANLSGSQGDTLYFSADGDITDGALGGSSLLSYNLDAFGQTYGTPANATIAGRLTGSGAGPRPVTGGVLKFNFNHGGGGPRVVGAGGATF